MDFFDKFSILFCNKMSDDFLDEWIMNCAAILVLGGSIGFIGVILIYISYNNSISFIAFGSLIIALISVFFVEVFIKATNLRIVKGIKIVEW